VRGRGTGAWAPMWVLALGLAGLFGGSVGADGAPRSRVVAHRRGAGLTKST